MAEDYGKRKKFFGGFMNKNREEPNLAETLTGTVEDAQSALENDSEREDVLEDLVEIQTIPTTSIWSPKT